MKTLLKILHSLSILLFCLFGIVCGMTLIAFSLHIIDFSFIVDAVSYINYISSDFYLMVIIGLCGLLLLLFSLLIIQLCSVKLWGEGRNVAFNTSYGKVSVSLGALEDFLRRLQGDFSHIKDMHARLGLKKGKMIVDLYGGIYGEVNIVQACEHIQKVVKDYLIKMLSVDDLAIEVRVHINKVFSLKKKTDKQREEVVVPYRDYPES